MDNATGVAPALLKPEDVARALQVGRTKVFELIRSGELRSIKLGHHRRVSPAALADYVASLDGAFD
jgi:excisionase family DNA binding protein